MCVVYVCAFLRIYVTRSYNPHLMQPYFSPLASNVISCFWLSQMDIQCQESSHAKCAFLVLKTRRQNRQGLNSNTSRFLWIHMYNVFTIFSISISIFLLYTLLRCIALSKLPYFFLRSLGYKNILQSTNVNQWRKILPGDQLSLSRFLEYCGPFWTFSTVIYCQTVSGLRNGFIIISLTIINKLQLTFATDIYICLTGRTLS